MSENILTKPIGFKALFSALIEKHTIYFKVFGYIILIWLGIIGFLRWFEWLRFYVIEGNTFMFVLNLILFEIMLPFHTICVILQNFLSVLGGILVIFSITFIPYLFIRGLIK